MLDPFVILAPLLLLPVVGLLRFVGCGTLLELSEDPPLTVTPVSASVGPGDKHAFSASDPGGSPAGTLTWTVDLGAIGTDGTYVAPDPFVPAFPLIPGSTRTANIKVSSSTGLDGTATVTLTHVTGVTVTPSSATLAPGQSQAFTQQVKGTSDQKVAWSVAPANGSIDATGRYTAPAVYVPGSPPVTVVARSQADSDPLVLPGTATVNLISGNAAKFVATDTATKGNWKPPLYGTAGYAIAGKPTNFVSTPPAPYLPSLILTALPPATAFAADPTTDVRGLQIPPTYATRVADIWSVGPGIITLDLQFNDFAPHRVAIYCVDWDTNLRKQRVEILDPSQVPPAVLDTQNLSLFNGGLYLIWDLSGHVVLRITKTGSGSAVLSGIFFQ